MNIVYNTKAKDDLARINWKVREYIISKLGELSDVNNAIAIQNISNSNLCKINIDNHVVIAKLAEKDFNIITVLERKQIKTPSY